MTLVGDYEYSLERFSARGGDEFMFVAMLNRTPPLGNLNWKQGKLGVWGSEHLEPGGGSGRYPVTGIYSISLSTPASPYTPSALNLVLVEAKGVSTHMQSMRFINNDPLMNVTITFGERVEGFELSDVQASGAGPVTVVSLFDHGTSPDGKHTFSALINATQSGLTTISLEAGAANSTSGPSEPSFWSFLHSPPLDQGSWTNSVMLRDDSGRYHRGQEPLGGWHVTAIHMVALPLTNHLLVSGWLRRDEMPCLGGPGAGGRRQAGLTFILEPSALVDPPMFLNVTRVEEEAQYPFGSSASGTMEGHPVDGDAIYCAGHVTLRDGRVFYAGGARYAYVSSPDEHEYGLDYARLFDPTTNAFTRINWTMPLGRAWYPTCMLLPDGRVLVSGGYTDFATDHCYKTDCLNPQLNIFDPQAYDKGKDPWTVYVNSTYMTHDIDPGEREYTRLFVLPETIKRGGEVREVLAMGKAGIVYLLAMDPAVPMDRRMWKPVGGTRPGNCSDQSTAVFLVKGQGELVVIGGCSADTRQRIDIYNVGKDTWESIDTGIPRWVPSSFLLPDGNVLIVSGENTDIQQALHEDNDASQDPRYAQIFNPETRQVSTSTSRAKRFRGYHNTGALLADGSVVVGGGFNQHGDVGCENTDLQIYRPGYLSKGARPSFTSTSKFPLVLNLSAPVEFEFDPAVKVVGVSLLPPQAFTHSFGQSQRHVKLHVEQIRVATITVTLPSSPRLFPGVYWIFLLSDEGVPSIGLPVFVREPLDVPGPSVTDYVWLGVLVALLVLMAIAFLGPTNIYRRCLRRGRVAPEITPYTSLNDGGPSKKSSSSIH